MALFDRDQLPARSTLSRFLAALTEEPVEALRVLFLDDLLARPLTPDKQTGGLVDRKGDTWMVFDIDGTREAARQRALPQTDELPPPCRRLDDVCAPGYRGRKRGEVVRTRTTVSQAHSYQWLGSFGNRGNGRYREELRKGLAAIGRYLATHQLSPERALLRLDGQYGNGAVLSDVAGFAFVTRGKEYSVLGHPLVQARLHLPPDQFQQRPESQMGRSLYDCPEIPVGPEGVRCRVVVATHPAGKKKSPVGVTRAGVVYELFLTNLPQQGFTACDVVELYLHRGAFEPTLSDEDQEIDPDRWCSHSAWGQECWQLVSQWVWNLRLELGHQLSPMPLRTTEFAVAGAPQSEQTATSPARPLLLLDTALLPRLPPSKWGVSPEPTFLSSPMGRSGVQRGSRLLLMSGAGKPMAACVWCMAPAFAVVVPVHCAHSASGMAAPPQSRARSACCCIRSRWGLPRCSGGIGVGGFIVAPASACCATNGWRSPCRRPCLPSHVTQRASCPGPSGPILACRGKHGWRAMPGLRLLTGPPSSSPVSRKPSPRSSACRQRKVALAASARPLLGQAYLSE